MHMGPQDSTVEIVCWALLCVGEREVGKGSAWEVPAGASVGAVSLVTAGIQAEPAQGGRSSRGDAGGHPSPCYPGPGSEFHRRIPGINLGGINLRGS